jgi:hypothetical protein
MKKRFQLQQSCCRKSGYCCELAWSTDPKETHPSTQIAATQAEAGGGLVGLKAEISLKGRSSRERFRRGRQNSASFRRDQSEKLGERLFNNRGLYEKGLLFFL